ncbi:MAG: lysophospholipase [Candidatus Dormibacteria bacterium]
MSQQAAGLEEREGTFKAPDGVELYYVSRRDPTQVARRLVITVHGFADHAGRMPYLVQHLAGRGAVVYSFDQRGNGKSPGRRGHIDSYQEIVEDLKAFIELATGAEPGLERVLLGHSTGGILAMALALQEPAAVDRLVLSAPALVLAFKAPAWKDSLARVMAVLRPTLTMQAGFPPESVAREPEVIRANKADPLVVQDMSSRFYSEVYLNAAPSMLRRAGEIKIPFLLLQGTGDLLVDPDGAEQLNRSAEVPHVYRTYEGAYHEIFNDICREEVFADLDHWLEAPIP